jgi:hypothetical protein
MKFYRKCKLKEFTCSLLRCLDSINGTEESELFTLEQYSYANMPRSLSLPKRRFVEGVWFISEQVIVANNRQPVEKWHCQYDFSIFQFQGALCSPEIYHAMSRSSIATITMHIKQQEQLYPCVPHPRHRLVLITIVAMTHSLAVDTSCDAVHHTPPSTVDVEMRRLRDASFTADIQGGQQQVQARLGVRPIQLAIPSIGHHDDACYDHERRRRYVLTTFYSFIGSGQVTYIEQQNSVSYVENKATDILGAERACQVSLKLILGRGIPSALKPSYQTVCSRNQTHFLLNQAHTRELNLTPFTFNPRRACNHTSAARSGRRGVSGAAELTHAG